MGERILLSDVSWTGQKYNSRIVTGAELEAYDADKYHRAQRKTNGTSRWLVSNFYKGGVLVGVAEFVS